MLNNLLNFGHYTEYILTAYGISFIVLLALVLISLRQRAHYARATTQTIVESSDQ